MRIEEVKTNKQRKAFIQFIYQNYENDTSFKDTLISVVKTFLYRLDTFTKESYIKPILITEYNKILAQCILIYHDQLPALQIGFFDALPNQAEAVEYLINEAKREANQLFLDKIIIGLNGHVSYGVGLLMDHYDQSIPFDSLYNKAYYLDYFNHIKSNKLTLTTYAFQLNKLNFSHSIISKVAENYSFRYLDKSKYQEEMLLFGKLCNETLKDTPLYFPCKPICMVELLQGLKPFLKPEHLIFALKDGKEIGFVFWHPDYNEIIPGGKRNNMLNIGFRFLFKQKNIKRMIINSIGILEPYKRTSVAYGLLNEVAKVTKNRYISGVSNFVFDTNLDSTLFNRANTESEDRHYCIYEMNL